MKHANLTETCLSQSILNFIELKQALGRSYQNERWVLWNLNEFMHKISANDLTQTEFDAWSKTQSNAKGKTRRNRMLIVRGFCLYRARSNSSCFVPDTRLFPSPHQPKPPHIYSEAEIVRLMEVAKRLDVLPNHALQPHVFLLAIVLLYTSGLWIGELKRLNIGDYERQEQVLYIRESKFKKSRYVPLSADASQVLEAYLTIRQKVDSSLSNNSPLLGHGRYGQYSYKRSGLYGGIRKLIRDANVRKADGSLPRIHDLRHTFAIRSLMRWYRSGLDVQSRLPMLASYMGHVSITSTETYLRFMPETAIEASNRFCNSYGYLIQPLLGGKHDVES